MYVCECIYAYIHTDWVAGVVWNLLYKSLSIICTIEHRPLVLYRTEKKSAEGELTQENRYRYVYSYINI